MAKTKSTKIDPNKKLEEGWAFLQCRDFVKAQEIGDFLKSVRPDQALVYYYNAHVSFDQENYKQAAALFHEAENKEERDWILGHIYYWLGQTYSKSSWIGKDEERYVYDDSKVRKYYELARGTENYPADAILADRGRFSGIELVGLYEMGMEKFPKVEDFYLLLAKHYQNAGLVKKQHLIYRKAIENELNSVSLFYNLAIIAQQSGELQKAKEYFLKAIEICGPEDPNLYGLNYCLGWTHEIGGEFLEARACYVSAVDTTYWEPDRWYGIIGVLNLDLVDSDPAKIQEFVMDINFSSHLFEGGTTWAARPFFLSAHAVDDIDLHQVKDFYLKLSKVKFADLPDIYIGKLWMMRYLLAQGLGKSMESYKAIKNSIKYLFTSHYDFAHDLHLESLHGLILDCKDRENDIIRVYDLFLEELSSSHILKKAINILSDLIDLLYAKKMYDRIVELSKKFTDKELVKTERLFQLAYCLVHIKENKRGKVIYELHLKTEGESAAALNNLGLLYVENEQYEHALGLYTRGLEIDPEHENINKNIKIAQHRFDEIKAQEITRLTLEKEFRASTAALHLENDYILEKLSQFILQIKLQEDFKEWLVPIAKHKFYTLLNIDRQRAESIREQWLKKGYLKQTDDRDQNGSIIYSINPFMEAEMLKLSKHKIPKQWIDGFISISIQSLEQVDYFSIMERIVKVNKKFRALLERDFNELTYNHLLGLQKATIVLSGSLVELALTYYFERKKFKTIPVKDSKGNIKNKKLYDCVLSDLIDFSMEKNFFGNDFSYLSNLSRIYRNFIHPGRELKDSLDKGKADLCYISTREILKKIV